MPKANELKQGSIVDIDGEPYVVKSIEIRNPTSRGATTLYKIRFAHLISQQKLDQSLKSDDFLKEAECVRVTVQFSYRDDDEFYFMNVENYDQYGLKAVDLENEAKYLTDGLDGIILLLLDNVPAAIQLPTTIVMEVVDTPPAMKGASATSRTKPATLTTGLEIQVPEYIGTGEKIKVNSETGKFMSRA